MYADAFGLLVLPALLTSASLPKNRFFDRLKGVVHPDDPLVYSNSNLYGS